MPIPNSPGLAPSFGWSVSLLPSGELLLSSTGRGNTSLPPADGFRQGTSVSGGRAPAPTGTETKKDGAPPPQRQPPTDACGTQLLIFLPFLLLMYFFLIRPQQKQEKVRRQMLSALKKGDHVVTSGGIHGQVVGMQESTVLVKFGSEPGQRFKIDRSAVTRIVSRDDDSGQKGGGSK